MATKKDRTILCLNRNVWMLQDLGDQWAHHGLWINRYWVCDDKGRNISPKHHYQVSGYDEQYVSLKGAKAFVVKEAKRLKVERENEY